MVIILMAFALGLMVASRLEAAPNDPTGYFSETGYRIGNQAFQDYFEKRGGVRTFGYPVSRVFTLNGLPVQIFQRRVLQIAGGRVNQLNLLDAPFLPYTRFGGATVPPLDEGLVKQAPTPGSSGYDQAVLRYVRTATAESGATNSRFYDAFRGSVRMAEAYPRGGGNDGLLQGAWLEMWGVPTSRPMGDPNNGNFVYQRFQRGVMHFDRTTGTTQALLLGDYFKSVLTGQNLPPDLAEQARGGVYFARYDNGQPDGMRADGRIDKANLKDAFEREPMPARAPAPAPATKVAPPAAAPAPATATGGLQLGWQAHFYGQPGARIVAAIKDSGFGWVKQQVRWSTHKDSDLDQAIGPANAAGIKVLVSVVTTPSNLRGGRGEDGPPDDYKQFGAFVGGLATRYKGRIHAYELWNEENFSREWGGNRIDPCAYVRLLREGYQAIKAADPNAVVISGALTPTGVTDANLAVDDKVYLEQMYQCEGGAFLRVADAVGAHMAGYNNAPEDEPGKQSVNTPGFKGHMSFYFKRIDDLHGVMAANKDPRPMWLTEYHWASAQGPVPDGYEWTTHLSEDQAADFLARSVQSIRQSRPWVGAVFVWNLNFRTFQDYHKSETAIFGMLNEDWSPRKLFEALKALTR
jgi:hypothetical protein